MDHDATLPAEIAALLKAELARDEHIVWSGQPIPARFAQRRVDIFLGGILATAFSIFFGISGVLHAWNQSKVDAPGFVFMMLICIPLVLTGTAMLSSPFWLRREALRTAYVITDRRAIVFDAKLGEKRAIRSFAPRHLNDIQRVAYNDGAGDLIFKREWEMSLFLKRGTEIGFLAIVDFDRVDYLIRELAGEPCLQSA